ncbi:MAG: ABC transporter permease [Clostridiales bacterium]|nr:ABC transporter permease [Clostridiales bacterium]
MKDGKTAVAFKYRGRIAQVGIYLKKFMRMFVYQSDWKVLPIGAIIAALVTLVTGKNMFVTMEGTNYGSFALTCACIWNGVFNSIQVVCRERDIVKREHRGGMHISSYVAAHMLYQLFLCLMQTGVTLLICWIVGVKFPVEGIVTPWGVVDLAITILIVTYTADILGLMVSCMVRTSTTAMTIVPFLLIFQLIFNGNFFKLGRADFVKHFTISHWGMDCMCTVGRYNTLPMTTLWKTMVRFKDVYINGEQPIKDIVVYMKENDLVDSFKVWSGQNSGVPAYEAIPANVWHCWGALLLMIAIFAIVSVIVLRLIDRDKR